MRWSSAALYLGRHANAPAELKGRLRMTQHENEIDIPDAVLGDKKALELARIWATEEGQHIRFRSDLWEDPATWGLMLVDFAKLAAKSYAEDADWDCAVALARIKEGLDAEWESAMDEPGLTE